ncbi:hypothetical protein BG844_09625 [Couchioplanes caeruleus subsp. caeruleus]|uniref:Uncharacterized protein n=1 Tax=Couchioplanes caeruleus subsp. caeruleus TaxID=56427 RepID=A0A1K0FP58_9ACTN|nr:hypothetical protein BG844_09625 [Couchioplanes caeruleus subsp. caeruleus]
MLSARAVVPGQMALEVEVPEALRVQHWTGLRVRCTDCRARGSGAPRLGLPNRVPGDPSPLCLSCWRRRERRTRHRAGRGPSPVVVDAAAVARLACEACGRSDGAGGCWRCGDQATWLAAARAMHEDDQAQAAAEAARVDDLLAAHEASLRAVRRAQRRLDQVTRWRQRVARVVAAQARLTKTGPRGQLRIARGPGRWARAAYLLADFLARDAAERTRRGLSRRGRRPQYPRVVAVMAVAACCESGRGSMAGLYWTAQMAGVAERTVTTGWARTVQLGCTRRTRKGRILAVAERRALGRPRQRAVYDFQPLHRSPVAATPYLGAAVALLAQLLQRAGALVDECQAKLDEAVAAAAAIEAEVLDARAWQAERRRDDLALQAAVDPAWTVEAEQATKTAVLARGRANLAAAPPADAMARVPPQARRTVRDAAAEAVDNAFDQAGRWANFCDHSPKGFSKRISSGLWFYRGHPATDDVTAAETQRPHGRGTHHNGGASRPAPTKDEVRLTGSSRPRTAYRMCSTPPQRHGRSAVMGWAKPLAKALANGWEYLGRFLQDADDGRRNPRNAAREHGRRLAMIAATLGSRLGPDWTAGDVVHLVEHYGLTGRPAERRQVIAAGDAHSPLSYLARALDRALTHPTAQVPHHSPVREAYERELHAAERATMAAHTAALRAELDQRDATAAAERSGPRAGLAAARKVAAGAQGPARVRSGEVADREQMAPAQAELAARASRPTVDDRAGFVDWPTVHEPGSGLSHRVPRCAAGHP